MHPLIGDLSVLKDADIENKIQDLTRKYFMSNNFDLQQQIGMVLSAYKEELANRQRQAYEKMMQTRNKDLDKLINVS
jgi:hypothetical protein